MPTRLKYLEKQIMNKRLCLEKAPGYLKEQLEDELRTLEFEYKLLSSTFSFPGSGGSGLQTG